MSEKPEENLLPKLARDIEKIRTALDTLKRLGLSRELMVIYISHKTKLGRYKVEAVLKAQEEFLREATLRTS